MTLKDLESQYASVSAASSAAFIRGIHAAKNDPAVTTLDLLGFLGRIIEDFRPEGERICAEAPDIPAPDRDALTIHVLDGKIRAEVTETECRSNM